MESLCLSAASDLSKLDSSTEGEVRREMATQAIANPGAMAAQNIELWPVERLVEYPRNPRKNDAAVDRMCGSIREFGFKIPCLVRSDGEVVDGHLRLKAARKLGITEIADIEALILAGHPDLHGLCLALADWSAELRIIKADKRETPPGRNPAARCERNRANSGFDGIAALAVLALGGRDGQAHLLADRAGQEPAHGMRLPAGGFHAVPCWWLRPAASAGPGSWRSCCRRGRLGLAFFALLGAFLAGVAFFPALALAGATLRATCAQRWPFWWLSARLRAGVGRFRFLLCRCHDVFSFGGDYRGHDMDHSGGPEMQVNSEAQQAMEWRWPDFRPDAQMRQMTGHGSKFGRKKEEAIAALLTQRNIEEAARSIGVAPNTLLKWQKLPEFETGYREARKAAYRQAVARLQQGTSAAATTLLKTLIDPDAPPSVKVRAAEAIFNHAAKAIEIEDIDARVSELERAAGESNPGKRRS